MSPSTLGSLISSCLALCAIEMGANVIEEYPPRTPTNETMMVSDAPEFREAEEVLADVFSHDKFVVQKKTYSASAQWGYVLRAVVITYTSAGDPLPPTYFVRWRKRNECEGAFVAPLGDE
jgi:hypothetical protein